MYRRCKLTVDIDRGNVICLYRLVSHCEEVRCPFYQVSDGIEQQRLFCLNPPRKEGEALYIFKVKN